MPFLFIDKLCFILKSVDVNECSEGTHVCQGVCDNTLGSYQCMCGAGFTLSSDGHTCEGTYPRTMFIILSHPYKAAQY